MRNILTARMIIAGSLAIAFTLGAGLSIHHVLGLRVVSHHDAQQLQQLSQLVAARAVVVKTMNLSVDGMADLKKQGGSFDNFSPEQMWAYLKLKENFNAAREADAAYREQTTQLDYNLSLNFKERHQTSLRFRWLAAILTALAITAGVLSLYPLSPSPLKLKFFGKSTSQPA